MNVKQKTSLGLNVYGLSPVIYRYNGIMLSVSIQFVKTVMSVLLMTIVLDVHHVFQLTIQMMINKGKMSLKELEQSLNLAKW